MSNSERHTSSHFFKVILPSTLEDKKLGIPVKFVRKFGDELPAVAMLRAPNGCVWPVRLKKDGRKIWLLDGGWNDFVKQHSISVGHFLVFKYVENSTFHVFIFDTSACEIDYPSTEEDLEDDKQVEMRNENSVERLTSTTRNKRPVGPLEKKESQCSKCKMEEPEEMDGRSNGGNDSDLLDLLEEKGICITDRHHNFSTEEREMATEIARLFKGKNPTFMIILRSNVKRSRCVYIPAKFDVKYVNASAKLAKLQACDGREWNVQIYRNSCRKNGFLFTTGWREFSVDNGIHEGDICVFELIRKEDVVLKVSVFHPTTLE